MTDQGGAPPQCRIHYCDGPAAGETTSIDMIPWPDQPPDRPATVWTPPQILEVRIPGGTVVARYLWAKTTQAPGERLETYHYTFHVTPPL